MARPKKDKRTPEQIAQERFEFNLRQMRSKYFNPPTYFFNVGDPVEIGNLQNAKVKEIYDNGNFYLIEFTGYDHNYGNPIYTPGVTSLWEWHEIRKPTTNNDSFVCDDDFQISLYNSNVSNLLTVYYSFGLDLDVEYQRDYVWTMEDKVNLIDSIFNNVKIGQIVLVHRKFKEGQKSYEALDGKQRISTLIDFYEDRFPYRERTYSELSNHDKYWFLQFGVSYGELDNPTKEQKLKAFIKLNTSGKVMKREDIDRAINLLNK